MVCVAPCHPPTALSADAVHAAIRVAAEVVVFAIWPVEEEQEATNNQPTMHKKRRHRLAML